MGATKKVAKKQRRASVIPPKYVAAVERGVLWLDLTFGRREWLRRMNMSKFDIQDPRTCVAGNVFRDGLERSGWGTFVEAMKMLGVKDHDGERFGFFGQTAKADQYLQDLWVRRIKSLKARA